MSLGRPVSVGGRPVVGEGRDGGSVAAASAGPAPPHKGALFPPAGRRRRRPPARPSAVRSAGARPLRTAAALGLRGASGC